MKLTKNLAEIFIGLFFVALIMFGIISINYDTLAGKIFFFVWLLSSVVLNIFVSTFVTKKYNKELKELQKEWLKHGGTRFLQDISSTERFKNITNKDLPILNSKYEEIGTTTVYQDLDKFLMYEFKPE